MVSFDFELPRRLQHQQQQQHTIASKSKTASAITPETIIHIPDSVKVHRPSEFVETSQNVKKGVQVQRVTSAHPVGEHQPVAYELETKKSVTKKVIISFYVCVCVWGFFPGHCVLFILCPM